MTKNFSMLSNQTETIYAHLRLSTIQAAINYCFDVLRDNNQPSFKSDLKFVESSGFEVTSIASPTVYSALKTDSMVITSNGARS